MRALLLLTMLTAGCATAPNNKPLYGPWGAMPEESHQEHLRRTYEDAWCDGFLAGYEAQSKEVGL